MYLSIMKVVIDSRNIIEKYAEAIAFNRARLIDGYCQLHIRKRPWYLPAFLYRRIMKKLIVLNFFREI